MTIKNLLGAGLVLVFFAMLAGLATAASSVGLRKVDVERIQAALHRGEIAFQQGQYQDAVKAYRRALRIKPDLAQAHHGLGLAWARLERYPEAQQAFLEAVRLEPAWARAHKDLGVVYLKLRLWPAAAHSFKTALQHQPKNPEVLYSLGIAEGRRGRHQKAREAFEQAVGAWRRRPPGLA